MWIYIFNNKYYLFSPLRHSYSYDILEPLDLYATFFGCSCAASPLEVASYMPATCPH